MKILLIAAAFAFAGFAASAQTYMTRTGRVSFFSSTALENIEAINNEAAAVIDGPTGEVAFKVPVKSFRFENALMQEHFNENYMESDKFPLAAFKGKLLNAQGVNWNKEGKYPVEVAGQLTIHGVTKDVKVPGTIVVNEASMPAVNTKFNIRIADYGIKVPGMVGGKIAENIEITIATLLTRK